MKQQLWFWGLALAFGFMRGSCLGQSRPCRVLCLQDPVAVPLAKVRVTLQYSDSTCDTLYTDEKGVFRYPVKKLDLLDSVRLEKKAYRTQQEKANSRLSDMYLTSCRIFKRSYDQRLEWLNNARQRLSSKRSRSSCYERLLRLSEPIDEQLTSGLRGIDTEQLEWDEHMRLREAIDKNLAQLQLEEDALTMQAYRPAGRLQIEQATAIVLAKSQLRISLHIHSDSSCFPRRHAVRIAVWRPDKKPLQFMADSLSSRIEHTYEVLPGTIDTVLVFRVNPQKKFRFEPPKGYAVLLTSVNPRDTLAVINTRMTEPRGGGTHPPINKTKLPNDKVKSPVSNLIIQSTKLKRAIRVVGEVPPSAEADRVHVGFSVLSPSIAPPKIRWPWVRPQPAYRPWVQLYVYADSTVDTLYTQRYGDKSTIALAPVLLKNQSRYLLAFKPDSLASVQRVQVEVRSKRGRVLLRHQLGLGIQGEIEGIYINHSPKL